MTTSNLVAWFLTTALKMSFKTGVFDFLLHHYSDLWCYRDNYSIMENLFKKLRKNKNKLRTIYSKNHENFKSSKPRVQFYSFFKKRLKYWIKSPSSLVTTESSSCPAFESRHLMQQFSPKALLFWLLLLSSMVNNLNSKVIIAIKKSPKRFYWMSCSRNWG